eukprot:gb/GECG01011352.1/.p1 GENE.gb/GECG01011352.1/~~gb/GECG01011352.1/.p1  ORF type:complete len:927 (+),score=90.66 gb/GECG01011352.1/:1-2781(+)
MLGPVCGESQNATMNDSSHVAVYEEDKVEIHVPCDEAHRQLVFFKEEHKTDRDITTASIVSFIKQLQNKQQPPAGDEGVVRIADVFSGSGIRALRVGKTLERLGLLRTDKGQILLEAVDSSSDAIACMNDNSARNCLDEKCIQALQQDAIQYLENRKNALTVIELDPFGSVEQFLEPAINALKLTSTGDGEEGTVGAMLSVATFDTHDLLGASHVTPRRKFGSLVPKGTTGTAAEECAIRIVLHSMSETAYRCRHAHIVPLVCYNFDFGFRLVVSVHPSSITKIEDSRSLRHTYLWCNHCQWILASCNSQSTPATSMGCALCRSESVEFVGPLWSGALFRQPFLKASLQGLKRHGGRESREMLLFALKEANVSHGYTPFLFNMRFVDSARTAEKIPAKQLCRNVYSALRKRGYSVLFGSILVSCSGSSILRSDCPSHVMLYTVRREWSKLVSSSRSTDTARNNHQCKRRGSIKVSALVPGHHANGPPLPQFPFISLSEVSHGSTSKDLSLIFWTDIRSKKSQLFIQLPAVKVSAKEILDALHLQKSEGFFPPISAMHVAGSTLPVGGQSTELLLEHFEIDATKSKEGETLILNIDGFTFRFPQQPHRYSIMFEGVRFVDASNSRCLDNLVVAKGCCSILFYRCRFISEKTSLSVCSKAWTKCQECSFMPTEQESNRRNSEEPPRKRARRGYPTKHQGRHIFSTGQSRCEVDQCYFYGSRGPSIECRSGSEVKCCRSEFIDSLSSSLFIHKDGKCLAVDVSISGSGWAGVEVRERGSALLYRCMIGSSERGGVYCVDNGKVMLDNTVIRHCAFSGLHCADGGTGTLRGNVEISGNGGHGLFVQGKHAAALIQLEKVADPLIDLSSNAGDAIHVCTDGTLSLQQEELSAPKQQHEEIQDFVSKLFKECYASCTLPDVLINGHMVDLIS